MATIFPDVLYHYTDSHALLSIASSNSLWMSSHWHLNDYLEGQIFTDFLTIHANNIDLSSQVQMVINQLQQHEFYVTCLTTHGDMLSQWRGYAQNGEGVSIGFDSAELIKVIAGRTDALLYPVSYVDDYSKLPKTTTNLMTSILNSTGTPSDSFVQTVKKEQWSIKSRAFSEEDEYRLILTPRSTISQFSLNNNAQAIKKFRATSTEIRDYYELTLPPKDLNKVIRQVVLGPKNRSSVEVVQRMLESKGLGYVDVVKSAASYR